MSAVAKSQYPFSVIGENELAKARGQALWDYMESLLPVNGARSVGALARRAGLRASTVTDWHTKGKAPDTASLGKLATALGVGLADLQTAYGRGSEGEEMREERPAGIAGALYAIADELKFARLARQTEVTLLDLLVRRVQEMKVIQASQTTALAHAIGQEAVREALAEMRAALPLPPDAEAGGDGPSIDPPRPVGGQTQEHDQS